VFSKKRGITPPPHIPHVTIEEMIAFLEEVLENIRYGVYENLNLEFKDSFDYDLPWPRERFIRSVLALSNTADGGKIIIGLKEDGDKVLAEGVKEDHLKKFEANKEEIKAKVLSFSSSPIDFDMYFCKVDEKVFIVCDVKEFSFTPIICKNNGEYKNGDSLRHLEQGVIYIRTLKDKPSSVKAVDFVDVEFLLERAVNKKITNKHKAGWFHTSEKAEYDYKKERGDF